MEKGNCSERNKPVQNDSNANTSRLAQVNEILSNQCQMSKKMKDP